jgi:hypothetical protein
MADSGNDGWPKAAPQSDYLIPGPGMSSIQPWTFPKGGAAPPVGTTAPDVEHAASDGHETTADVHDPEPAAPASAGNGELRHRTEPAAAQQPSNTAAPDLPPYLDDELAPILASAQRAAAQIVERARAEARAEQAHLIQSRDELEARIAELAAWRKNIEPLVQTFHGKIAEMQSRMSELPNLIRSGLDPLASTVASMDPTLAAMTAASEDLLSLEAPAKH